MIQVKPITVIDYRFEDGRFPVYASCVTISNHNLLFISETGVNSGIRSWKKHSSEWAWCQKAIGGIYFTKKWRTETLQPGLEFGNFKLKSGIFKCISWLNGPFSSGWWSDFSEKGSQDPSNGTNVAYLPANFSAFTSIVYDNGNTDENFFWHGVSRNLKQMRAFSWIL